MSKAIRLNNNIVALHMQMTIKLFCIKCQDGLNDSIPIKNLLQSKCLSKGANNRYSGCLRQNMVSESETLLYVELELNVSIFCCAFEINQVIALWGNSSTDFPTPSTFTFALLFRFDKSSIFFSPLLKILQKIKMFLH